LQSLSRREDLAEVFDGYGLVIVDECHHLPAVTFETQRPARNQPPLDRIDRDPPSTGWSRGNPAHAARPRPARHD
jgi:hypothetical protein